MNRSNTDPRSFSADQLRAALGDAGGPARPDYLPDIVAQAGHIRQRPARTFLGGWVPMDVAVPHHGVRRAAVLFAALSMMVTLLASGLVYIGSQRIQQERLPALPTTPDAWQRVLIETPSVTGRVASVAVGPQGLLAVVGGDEPARLAVSTEGRTWTLVPDDQHPLLSNDRSFGMPSVIGTDRGFLMLQLNEVWFSANGYDWRRLAGESTDPALYPDGADAATTGGPGLVGVGGGLSAAKAYVSVDGSDWSSAEVPPLPEEILARPESDRYVGMTGVTAAGDDLVAWGLAEVPTSDDPTENLVVPLLWASHDGLTWTDVADPTMDSVAAVAGGPGGFIAAGQADSEPAIWLSADGEVWEKVGEGSFTSPTRAELNAASATDAGYVVVGTAGQCAWYPCQAQEIVIWTSADGRSWSRTPSTDLTAVAQAYGVVAWGSRFVIGGASNGKPVIWISGSDPTESGAISSTDATPSTPTPTPGRPVDFTGTWQATDPPPDGSHLTMVVTAMSDGSYEVTIRDDDASVCDGAPSTMTGVAEQREPGTIVIAQPKFRCDDGSEAQALSGPPLHEQLRGFGFSYDSPSDALRDSLGLEWTRAESAP